MRLYWFFSSERKLSREVILLYYRIKRVLSLIAEKFKFIIFFKRLFMFLILLRNYNTKVKSIN